MELTGKTALVTGASSGIGLECVKALLCNGVKHVAMLDVDENKGIKAAEDLSTQYGQGSAIFIKTDVTKKDQLEAGFQKAFDTFKGLDIVFNNAGVANDGNWECEIAINLNAVVYGSLLALKYMGKDCGGSGGVVVNTASILGLAAMAGIPVYTATKHAVVGFSRSLGMPFHVDGTGVRVIALCPGVTDTQLVSGAGGRQLRPDWGVEAARGLGAEPRQKTEDVAAAFIHVLKHAKSGSVWVSEGGQPVYEVAIPERKAMKVPT